MLVHDFSRFFLGRPIILFFRFRGGKMVRPAGSPPQLWLSPRWSRGLRKRHGGTPGRLRRHTRIAAGLPSLRLELRPLSARQMLSLFFGYRTKSCAGHHSPGDVMRRFACEALKPGLVGRNPRDTPQCALCPERRARGLCTRRRRYARAAASVSL